MTDPILQSNYNDIRLFGKKGKIERPVSKEESYLFKRKQKYEVPQQSKDIQMFNTKKKIAQKVSEEKELFKHITRIKTPESKERDMFKSKTRLEGPVSEDQKLFATKKQVEKQEKKEACTMHKKYKEVINSQEIPWKREKKQGEFSINKNSCSTFGVIQQDLTKSSANLGLAKSSVFNKNTFLEQDLTQSMFQFNGQKSNPMKNYEKNKQSSQISSIISQMPVEAKQIVKSKQIDNMKGLISQESQSIQQTRQVSAKCTETQFAKTTYNFDSQNSQDFRRQRPQY